MKLVRLVLPALLVASLSSLGVSAAEPARWEPTAPGTVASWTSVDLFAGGIGYASTGGTTLYKTQDSGASWIPLPGPVGETEIRRMSFASADTGFIASGPTVHRTDDGGITWEAMTGLPPPAGAFQGPFVDGLEAVPGSGRVVATAWAPTGTGCDTARSKHLIARWSRGRWRTSSLPYPASIYEIEFFDRSNGLMLAHKFERETSSDDDVCAYVIRTAWSFVLLTRDGGRTWTEIHRAAFVDQDPVRAVAMPSPRRIVLGTRDGTILLSNDGGRTFRRTQRLQINGPMSDGVLDSVPFATRKIGYAGTNGLGIWRTNDGGRTWTLESSPFEGTYADDEFFRGSIGAAGRHRAIASGPGSLAARQP